MQQRRNRREQKALADFGARVRKRRLELGMSQEDLGEIANLHRTYIGGIERGERNLPLLNLLRLIGALEVDSGDLLDDLIRR